MTISATPVSQEAHAEFRSRRAFGSLDGLRAASVVAVIWHHTSPAYHDDLPYVLANGHHGVTLFFAISGFLIVTLLLRERERTGAISLTSFYVRRGLRIFPLYYSVVLVYIVAVYFLESSSAAGREFFRNLPFFLSYTSNWFVHLDGRVIFYFAWSLAAEEQFYLAWPAIEKYVPSRIALALLCAVIAAVIAAQSGGRTETALLLRMLAGIPLAICAGVLLAHALHRRRSFDFLRPIFGSRLSSLAWLTVLLASLSWRAAPEALVHGAAVMFVGACVYREDHFLAWILRGRVVAHIGVVSYGVYLTHMLVKNSIVKLASVAQAEFGSYGVFILTVIGSAAVATLSYKYLEGPFLRLKARYSNS